MSANHDKVFVMTFTGVLGFLIALTVVIFAIANVLDNQAAGDELEPERLARIDANTQPVGQVNTDPNAKVTMPAVDEGAADMPPEQVVADVCAGCHVSGVLGAPKIGDAGSWAKARAAGMDAMVQNAINGKGAMPPRGGNPALTDEQIRAAVEHMLK
ncbi:MAG: c-type cytochrome [Salinisphaeraceae bacterium]|nr:c-type cytochrome [Salinisphaeraceae bacterium]